MLRWRGSATFRRKNQSRSARTGPHRGAWTGTRVMRCRTASWCSRARFRDTRTGTSTWSTHGSTGRRRAPWRTGRRPGRGDSRLADGERHTQACSLIQSAAHRGKLATEEARQAVVEAFVASHGGDGRHRRHGPRRCAWLPGRLRRRLRAYRTCTLLVSGSRGSRMSRPRVMRTSRTWGRHHGPWCPSRVKIRRCAAARGDAGQRRRAGHASAPASARGRAVLLADGGSGGHAGTGAASERWAVSCEATRRGHGARLLVWTPAGQWQDKGASARVRPLAQYLNAKRWYFEVPDKPEAPPCGERATRNPRLVRARDYGGVRSRGYTLAARSLRPAVTVAAHGER